MQISLQLLNQKINLCLKSHATKDLNYYKLHLKLYEHFSTNGNCTKRKSKNSANS